MPVSSWATAAARVRVTVAPLMAGEPLRITVPSEPPAGVFFTSNALLARFAAAARVSSKVSTREAPLTAAELTVGAVLSASAVAVTWSDQALSVPAPRLEPTA